MTDDWNLQALPFKTLLWILLLSCVAFAAIFAGCRQLKKAWLQRPFQPEAYALAVAWVFVVGSVFWLGIYVTNRTFLGFGPPWTWFTAAHFFFAGYGALTFTARCCSLVTRPVSKSIVRTLLFFHPPLYLCTAAGILGYPYCDEISSLGYELLFVLQAGAVFFGSPPVLRRSPKILLTISLLVPILTLIPAIAWAWQLPIFGLEDMIRYHGIVNAIGHVGLGFLAFALIRSKPSLRQLGTTPS